MAKYRRNTNPAIADVAPYTELDFPGTKVEKIIFWDIPGLYLIVSPSKPVFHSLNWEKDRVALPKYGETSFI